ncbi:MAG: universal stress protein [Chitinophagaceae bacterium]|nr:MAG: universal stress protein [Chitinophagaceae bacterium]
MKTILVATDFSVPAENAAHYAIQLAKLIKADILLCNAYKVPADAPMAAQVPWPLMNEEDSESESDSYLTQLVERLSGIDCKSDHFYPQITFESEKGELGQVIREFTRQKKVELVVMGMAGAGQLIQWALGSSSKTMIDEAEFPVLYVPSVASFHGIKKIAFASSLSVAELKALQLLCKFAKQVDAEVIVYHICGSELKRREELDGIDKDFYESVVQKIDYKKIKYENIWHSDIHEGLRWIRNNKEIDMIAMVHRQHTLVDKLVNGSYAHKLSRFTCVPLLIFQHKK